MIYDTPGEARRGDNPFWTKVAKDSPIVLGTAAHRSVSSRAWQRLLKAKESLPSILEAEGVTKSELVCLRIKKDEVLTRFPDLTAGDTAWAGPQPGIYGGAAGGEVFISGDGGTVLVGFEGNPSIFSPGEGPITSVPDAEEGGALSLQKNVIFHPVWLWEIPSFLGSEVPSFLFTSPWTGESQEVLLAGVDFVSISRANGSRWLAFRKNPAPESDSAWWGAGFFNRKEWLFPVHGAPFVDDEEDSEGLRGLIESIRRIKTGPVGSESLSRALNLAAGLPVTGDEEEVVVNISPGVVHTDAGGYSLPKGARLRGFVQVGSTIPPGTPLCENIEVVSSVLDSSWWRGKSYLATSGPQMDGFAYSGPVVFQNKDVQANIFLGRAGWSIDIPVEGAGAPAYRRLVRSWGAFALVPLLRTFDIKGQWPITMSDDSVLLNPGVNALSLFGAVLVFEGGMPSLSWDPEMESLDVNPAFMLANSISSSVIALKVDLDGVPMPSRLSDAMRFLPGEIPSSSILFAEVDQGLAETYPYQEVSDEDPEINPSVLGESDHLLGVTEEGVFLFHH